MPAERRRPPAERTRRRYGIEAEFLGEEYRGEPAPGIRLVAAPPAPRGAIRRWRAWALGAVTVGCLSLVLLWRAGGAEAPPAPERRAGGPGPALVARPSAGGVLAVAVAP